MLIKTTLIAATAAFGLAGAAMADGPKVPLIMDDQALDTVVAGATMRNWYGGIQHATGVDYSVLEEALATAAVSSDGVINIIDDYRVSISPPPISVLAGLVNFQP